MSPSGEKMQFLGLVEISGQWDCRSPKIWPGKEYKLTAIFKNFKFKSKTKKLCSFEISQFKILKNSHLK